MGNAEKLVKKELRIRITFVESVLGTASANPKVHEDYIASKAPTADRAKEEVESLNPDEEFSKALTIFPKMDDGTPFFWNYQVEGFLKAACGALRDMDGTSSKKIKSYKKAIDHHVFVQPRKIPIKFDGEINILERPLRASTPQGERVALASSEEIPAGSTIEFTIQLLKPEYEDAVVEWLDYGELEGIGQWRNSGEGRFLYEILDDDGNVIGGNPPISEDDLMELLGSEK